MKDMRAVLVNQNACVVVMIISITAYVWTPVTNQNLFIGTRCESFGENTAGKAGAYNEIIKPYMKPSLVRLSSKSLRRRLLDG